MHLPPVQFLALSTGLSLDPIAKPIAAILAAIYSVVPNYGVAILVLSLAWMILIAPLTLKTTRSMLAMQKLQPQIKKLQEQHRNDRAALSQATMDLYKEHNVSPFGSCLPTLLPLPIFFALFRVIDGLSHTVNGVAAPKYLSKSTTMYHDIKAAGGHLNAFGIDLSKNLFSHHSGVGAALPYAALILVMMGTQYLQTVQMMSRNPAAADNPQAKMMKYLPIVFGIFFLRFPAGVILYYAMSNVCRIGQQTLMYRYDPKVKNLAAREIREIEAETREIETGKRKRELPAQPAPKSRFRDLLASAAEQSARAREDSQSAKGPSTNPTPPKATAKGKGAGSKVSGATSKASGSGTPSPDRNGKATASSGKRVGTGSVGTGSVNSGGGVAKRPNDTAANGNQAAPTDGSQNGDGITSGPPRTGAGTGSGGRTGAASTNRTNRKRRGR